MCFHLDYGRVDSRGFIDGLQFVQTDVRKSDRPALAMIHETFHRFPGVEQSHLAIVNNIAALIPRILVVPGLKCKWSVNEIEIQIFEPESAQTRLESRFDALGPVIGVPQFCGDE